MGIQGEHGISWTDITWNPLRGCSRVSEGCRNCYAERQAIRQAGPGGIYEGLVKIHKVGDRREPRWTGQITFDKEKTAEPLRWTKPQRVFVNSMSDLFHEEVEDDWIDRIFAVMALCPQHTFQVLTKRPELMKTYLCEPGRRSEITERACIEAFDEETIVGRSGKVPANAKYVDQGGVCGMQVKFDWPLPNVWLGTSVEDQKTADERIPHLLQTPAAVRWISYEPALGPLDLEKVPLPDAYLRMNGITGVAQPKTAKDTEADDYRYAAREVFKLHWVVCGGESGPGARPMHPDWARSVRDQCVAAGVPYFFKQWGAWIPTAANGFTQWPEIDPRRPVLMPAHPGRPGVDSHQVMKRVSKKEAGRELDGTDWSQYPK